MLLHWATIATVTAFFATWPTPAQAYIPAQGTNETGVAQAAGLNLTDVSRISLQWFPMGSYSETVSYQLVGADSTGISKGALVHFSEDKLHNDTSGTPWIALVSCDANSTNASMEDDIFTLARDRGAVAALLYSLQSVTCIINTEYSNPAKFDQVMDIFATQALTSSQLIEDQFVNSSSSKYYWFSASLLNDSSDAIQTAISTHAMPTPGYLFATLAAWNATDNSTDTGTATSVDNGSGGAPPDKNTNTSLAMIILYAITGCVSALFCVVIISGAIRAIRHPERYGPRSAGTDGFGGTTGGFGPQSRARGLTRAILDTFPVVKFGRADAPPEAAPTPAKDIESVGTADMPYTSRDTKTPVDAQGVELELREWQIAASQLESDSKPRLGDDGDGDGHRDGRGDTFAALPTLRHSARADAEDEEEDPSKRASSSSHVPPVVPRPPKRPVHAGAVGERDVVPDAIGRETCPICIVDFEEGDDLRVLPCEGHHRFHQECVDQWLLELSSSCPLCRQDFHALQTMMAASDEGEHLEPPHFPGAARPLSTAAARFSRYLKFARRRRQRHGRGDSGEFDAANRPMSVAEEPAM